MHLMSVKLNFARENIILYFVEMVDDNAYLA